MSRVKRGTSHTKKRRQLLKKVKGFKWGRKKLVRLAKTASVKAGARAYIDRRLKKRTRRGLWQTKIGAFVKDYDLSYSQFINLLKQANIALDRKTLADLAVNNKAVLAKIVEQAKAAGKK
jgi:large subunit ribosomal protein L20